MSRRVQIDRKTNETSIAMALDLDGQGTHNIATGVGFFDHMLTHLAKHGLFDLTVKCQGDLHIDAHHSVEDVGICFGKCLAQRSATRAAFADSARRPCRWTKRSSPRRST